MTKLYIEIVYSARADHSVVFSEITPFRYSYTSAIQRSLMGTIFKIIIIAINTCAKT